MPKVFEFLDYRQFLRSVYEAGKARNPNYTHRYIETKAGLKSAGHFAQILTARCNISPRVALRLATVLQLKKRESDYFESLVFFNQAKSHEEKNRYFARLMTFKEARHKTVERDQHAFYLKWYYSAVRELLDLKPFRGDYRGLGEMLRPPIGEREAKEAVALLHRLGLIHKKANGSFAKVDDVVTSGRPVESEALRAYQLDILDLTKEALDRFPKGSRNFSTLTLTLTNEDYNALLEELRAFRGRILEMARQSTSPDRVYQCNFQIFPLAMVPGSKL